jgi:hypothetical protein
MGKERKAGEVQDYVVAEETLAFINTNSHTC